MCGITGWFAPDAVHEQVMTSAVTKMAQTLHHRGPDDRGIWVDTASGIGLGHTRLSIVDLSHAGHQPMQSHCGRYLLSFNGEIYNHQDLRAALITECGEIDFNGHSDTETLLMGISTWGLEKTLRLAHGMFAMALWDRSQRRLYLARDRVGEKPLYYGRLRNGIVFGSELKALTAHPDWEGRIDTKSLALYLRHGYIPAPHSIFQGVAKVIPGEILMFDRQADEIAEGVRQCYWRHEITADGSLDEVTALERLDSLLRRTIRREMLADVPVGAFLSGGIDSSLIVALMQQESPGAVQTFTIGFDDPRYDEADHARRVATFLGTRHEELYVTAEDALSLIPALPERYDEPFADASAIPTMLVSHLARRTVTVALSGDGGDELFGGYNHYQWGARIHSLYRSIPYTLRSVVASFLEKSGRDWLPPSIGTKLARAGVLLGGKDRIELLFRIGSHWHDPASILIQDVQPYTTLDINAADAGNISITDLLMLHDKQYFLPDDIMVKVDRASMAVSLESRAPFLDHSIVEFAATLPMPLKIQDGKGKWLLRKLLKTYIPESLTERPKMGFGAPVGQWLRGPLQPWADELLDERRLCNQGLFNAQAVRAIWDAHRSGRQERGAQLWNLLMFQAWLAHQS